MNENNEDINDRIISGSPIYISGIKKTCPEAGLLLFPIRLLQQRNIRYLQEQLAQFGQQRQTVDANIFVFSVNHHVLEELIHRLAQGGQLNQRILIAPTAKYGCSLSRSTTRLPASLISAASFSTEA